MRTLFLVLIAGMCFTAAATAQRQTALYIDNGSGAFTKLTAPGGGGTLSLPSSGTLLTSGSTIGGTTVWNGSIIGSAYGGTGLNTSATAIGSLLYTSAAGTWSTLAPGTATYVLTSNGAGSAPTWQAAGGSFLPLSGGTMSGAINMGSNSITAASALALNTNVSGTPGVGTMYRDNVPIAWGVINTDGTLASAFGCSFTGTYVPGWGKGTSLLVTNWSSYTVITVVCSWALTPGQIPSTTVGGWYLGGSWDGTYINIESDNGTSAASFPAKISFVAYGR